MSPTSRWSYGATTPYEVLGVDRFATSEEIKSAYRRLSSQSHPDKGGTSALFIMVNDAYSLLSDPVSRKTYDLLSGVPTNQTSAQKQEPHSAERGATNFDWTDSRSSRTESPSPNETTAQKKFQFGRRVIVISANILTANYYSSFVKYNNPSQGFTGFFGPVRHLNFLLLTTSRAEFWLPWLSVSVLLTVASSSGWRHFQKNRESFDGKLIDRIERIAFIIGGLTPLPLIAALALTAITYAITAALAIGAILLLFILLS